MAIKYLKAVTLRHSFASEFARLYNSNIKDLAIDKIAAALIDSELIKKLATTELTAEGDIVTTLKLTLVLDTPEGECTKMDISKPTRGKV
jgi:hypothetical protein